MTAGGSAAERAAIARRVAQQKQREADRADQAAAAWEAGSSGERRLAEIIDGLTPDGFVHFADRSIPGSTANIDHVVVGAPGVFVLDAKAWAGLIEVDGSVLRHDGRSRAHEVEAARSTAVMIATALEGVLPKKVDVRPALCFVGEARLDGERFVDRVKLVNADDVPGWMRRFEGRLTALEVAAVGQLLVDTFPAKTAERPVTSEPPAELVVYLFPWKKSGKSRLYVKSNDGADVGYLDLVSGRVSSPSAEWERVLVQLLPHYVWGDSPGIRAADLSQEAQGAIRRFLDNFLRRPSPPPERPIIACYRWRRHGRDRLYLSRLAPGGTKTDLGFFDLDTGMLKTSQPGASSVLGYCGQRFQQLELDQIRASRL